MAKDGLKSTQKIPSELLYRAKMIRGGGGGGGYSLHLVQAQQLVGHLHFDLSVHLHDSGVPSHPWQIQGQQPLGPPLQVSPH